MLLGFYHHRQLSYHHHNGLSVEDNHLSKHLGAAVKESLSVLSSVMNISKSFSHVYWQLFVVSGI